MSGHGSEAKIEAKIHVTLTICMLTATTTVRAGERGEPTCDQVTSGKGEKEDSKENGVAFLGGF